MDVYGIVIAALVLIAYVLIGLSKFGLMMFLSLMVSITFVWVPLVFLFGANVAFIGAGVVSIILPIIWWKRGDKPLDPITESYFRNRGRGRSSTDDWGEGGGD